MSARSLSLSLPRFLRVDSIHSLLTGSTGAVAFAISQSTRTVTVFKSGRILTQIQHSAGHREKHAH